MQREVTVKELETAVNEYDDNEPIIVKRENKKDLIVISLEQYQKEVFLSKLEKSKKQYENGEYKEAELIFKELKEKYGY